MASELYRRLGMLCRIAHILYGFLTAKAATIHPLLATIMFISFTIYEFSEWIHDILIYRRPRQWDFPDDEYVEYGVGVALYVVLHTIAKIAGLPF